MLLRNLGAIIVVLVLFAMLAADVRMQGHEDVPKDVRSKIFKQVLADYSDARECVTSDDGGPAAAEENMQVEKVDLNRDGVSEYEVQMSGSCFCGMVNCSIYVYRPTANGGYEAILDDASGYGMSHLKTSSNGYVDLSVEARATAATLSETIYKYDGKRYREARATLTLQETGESKPLTRRVQFRRGASATTVTGKVSLALPDTLVIGARAGQTMSLQLAAPSPSVRFVLMTSKTTNVLVDDKRTWTGTLPETGDYIILVDADEKSRTYSMTISIK